MCRLQPEFTSQHRDSWAGIVGKAWQYSSSGPPGLLLCAPSHRRILCPYCMNTTCLAAYTCPAGARLASELRLQQVRSHPCFASDVCQKKAHQSAHYCAKCMQNTETQRIAAEQQELHCCWEREHLLAQTDPRTKPLHRSPAVLCVWTAPTHCTSPAP
jgi:hypothetical protein